MTYIDFARIPGPKRLKVLTVRERFYELCKGFFIDISGEFQLFMKLTNKHTVLTYALCLQINHFTNIVVQHLGSNHIHNTNIVKWSKNSSVVPTFDL